MPKRQLCERKLSNTSTDYYERRPSRWKGEFGIHLYNNGDEFADQFCSQPVTGRFVDRYVEWDYFRNTYEPREYDHYAECNEWDGYRYARGHVLHLCPQYRLQLHDLGRMPRFIRLR